MSAVLSEIRDDLSGQLQGAEEQALSLSPAGALPVDRLVPGSPALNLPVQLDVAIPLRSFKVRDLLELKAGEVLETDWSHSEDLPFWGGGVQLVWVEFEVVENRLAVRVTRLV